VCYDHCFGSGFKSALDGRLDPEPVNKNSCYEGKTLAKRQLIRQKKEKSNVIGIKIVNVALFALKFNI
jgi:hypothetical protein